MGNDIKRIYGDESNPVVSSSGSVRPFEKKQKEVRQELDQSFGNRFSPTATDLCRLSKLPVINPLLQLLRSRCQPPEDVRNLKRTLFQRLMDQLENEN